MSIIETKISGSGGALGIPYDRPLWPVGLRPAPT